MSEEKGKGKVEEGAKVAAGATEGTAPKANLPEGQVGGETEESKVKNLIPNIIRGRMPIAVVWMVRFGDQKGLATKELADLFGTTVGKITDIKKKSTFAYLPEDFKPTQPQKDEGIAWLQKHVGFAEGKVDKLLNELEGLKTANEAEATAFEALRVKNRGQLPTTKTGETADAGGGNRQAPPAAKVKKDNSKKDAAPAAKPSASDLI